MFIIIILGIVCVLLGLLGCVLPVLPGPPLAYLALLLLQFTAPGAPPFTPATLIVWGVITVIVTGVEYLAPIWGTQRFGGSKYGIWGGAIGLIIGLFFTQVGLLLGAFVGAVAGELIGGKSAGPACRAGFGVFIGFLTGVILKGAATLWMAVLFCIAAWNQIRTLLAQ